MKIIALTGKTGAGKSTVALTLKDMGCFIIDGDLVAREIVEKGKLALSKLCEAFGEDILLPDGTLDRKKLAQRAFSSPENTDLLNIITHPEIRREFIRKIDKAQKENYNTVIIDAAAILESDCKNLCQKVIVVHAPENIRLERIQTRDNISREAALTRIRAQKSDEYYFSQADLVIHNYPPHSVDINQLKVIIE